MFCGIFNWDLLGDICRNGTLGGSTPMFLAAGLGGGVFGDHCSPISDTTIISSMASASDHIDHVKTQIPYAAVGAGITTIIYFIIT